MLDGLCCGEDASKARCAHGLAVGCLGVLSRPLPFDARLSTKSGAEEPVSLLIREPAAQLRRCGIGL